MDPITYRRTIEIGYDELKDIENILQTPGNNTCDVLRTFTAVFEDGIEVDIKVCDSSDDTTPYIDPVIFDKGQEILCLEVRDNLLGEYLFSVRQEKERGDSVDYYVVEIKQKLEWDYYFIYMDEGTGWLLYGPFKTIEDREEVLNEARILSEYDSKEEFIDFLKSVQWKEDLEDAINEYIDNYDTWARFEVEKGAKVNNIAFYKN